MILGKKMNFIVFATSSVIKEAEANRLKLTPEFLQLKFIQAIANNTKIFFGDKVFPSSPMLIFVCPCTLTWPFSLVSRFLIWFWIRGCLGTYFMMFLEGELQRPKQISELFLDVRGLSSDDSKCITNILEELYLRSYLYTMRMKQVYKFPCVGSM